MASSSSPPNPPPGSAIPVWLHLSTAADAAIQRAGQLLLRPTAAGVAEAGALLEDLLARLREAEEPIRREARHLGPADRLSVLEQGGAFRLSLALLARRVDAAARLLAGRVEELSVERGYTAEGVNLPLSVVRSAGRRCNLQG